MTYPIRNMQTITIKSWYVNVEEFYNNFQKLIKNKDTFFRYNFVLDTSHTQEMFEVEGMDESDYNSSKHLSLEEMNFLIKQINEEIEEHNRKIGMMVILFKNEYEALNIQIPDIKGYDREFITPKQAWKSGHWSENAPMKRKRR